jgi:predicted house-cleaning noncanonical NTP pyrophosphatase (MazG superfamily)/catechol 2,3-dioxygenase-like lactoylglutathione lyase family enzyme
MLDHIDIKVQDLARTKKFYSAVLKTLGGGLFHEDEYGLTFLTGKNQDGYAWFGLGEPYPFHFAFQAANPAEVNEFYKAALANGGTDNGAPGDREADKGAYYAAFVIDPDAYRIEAVCHQPNENAKLVRDGIPDLIKAEGRAVDYEIMSYSKFEKALDDKIQEEALEVAEARSRADKIEELADVLEVVQATSRFYNISLDELEQARQEKFAARGGFENGVLLKGLGK